MDDGMDGRDDVMEGTTSAPRDDVYLPDPHLACNAFHPSIPNASSAFMFAS
jgi:hypothetical protein